MNDSKLKMYLLQIADKVDGNTTLEDLYNQLALLSDIDESEEQEKNGDVIGDHEVQKMAHEWLK